MAKKPLAFKQYSSMDGFVGLSEHLENDPLTFHIAPLVGQGFYLSGEISQDLSDIPTDFGVPLNFPLALERFSAMRFTTMWSYVMAHE